MLQNILTDNIYLKIKSHLMKSIFQDLEIDQLKKNVPIEIGKHTMAMAIGS